MPKREYAGKVGDAVDQSAAEAVLGLREGLDFQQIIEGTLECKGALSSGEAWEKIYGVPGRDWREQKRVHQEAREIGVQAEVNVHHTFFNDIFGNPFRPVAFDPAWRTSTAVGVATGIYEDRAFDRMLILADALQDAGCEDDAILSHCRGDGPRVRGCWVVDLVLQKT
jgi:hypothetical protein